MKGTKNILLLLLGLGFLGGCDNLEELPSEQESNAKDKDAPSIEIFFNAAQNPTKSSLNLDEQRVSSLGVYAYRDGLLDQSTYNPSGNNATLSLISGCRYNFYALANCPDGSLPLRESELQTWRISLPLQSQRVPMSWSSMGVSFNTSSQFRVELERLAAKLSFSVDKDLLQGLSIGSVRLRNVPTSVAPFASLGSKALAGEVSDGDYASVSDLADINAGGEIILYVPENCQGDLLQGNTDPMRKLPDNIGSVSALCTYLEVGCTFNELSPLSGDVLYRFYPGSDSYCNFDLVRNREYGVSMFLTPGGLGEVSWRVTFSATYRPGLIGGEIVAGSRTTGEMYIGEVMKYHLIIDPRLLALLPEGLLQNYRLNLIDSDGSTIDNISCGAIYREGGEYYSDIKALSDMPARKHLALLDSSGNMFSDGISDGPGFIVKKPRLRVSKTILSPTINGSGDSLFLLLVDEAGGNIISQSTYGFDRSLYPSFSAGVSGIGDAAASKISTIVRNGLSTTLLQSPSPYIASLSSSITNTGLDSDVNDGLSRIYSSSKATTLWNLAVSGENINGACGLGGRFELPNLSGTYAIDGQKGTLEINNMSFASVNAEIFVLAYPKTGMTFPNYDNRQSSGTYRQFIGSYSGFPIEMLMNHKEIKYNRASLGTGYSFTNPPAIKYTGAGKSLLELKTSAYSSSWGGAQISICVKTLGGEMLRCPITDNSTSRYGSDMNYQGLDAWDSSNMGSSKYNSILHNYSLNDFQKICAPAREGTRYEADKQSDGIKSYMLNNQGNRISAVLSAQYGASCSWTQKNGADPRTENYSVTVGGGSALTSGSDGYSTLILKSALDSKFAEINKNYWHESCTNAANLAGNRYASLAQPKDVHFTLTLSSPSAAWIPLSNFLELVNPLSLGSYTTACTLYGRTKKGTCPSKTVKNNPDGSNRWSSNNPSSDTASQYGDYETTSAKQYYCYVLYKGVCEVFFVE